MQDNEKKPALRFKGFTDPWEQRKLGEICDFITKGATPTTYGFSWQPDGVPFFAMIRSRIMFLCLESFHIFRKLLTKY